MTDRLVVVGGTQRWVLHRPAASDGYLRAMAVEIADEGLSATGTGSVEGSTGVSLLAFLADLAENWRGWEGARDWASLEGSLTVRARHDGRGLVRLTVTITRDAAHWDGWSATVVVPVEAGEQLCALAADAEEFFGREP